MEIRRITQDTLNQYLDLTSFAFQFEASAETREQASTELESRAALGVFVDDQLASGLQIIPFETYIQGKRFAMGGIAGVATWPEYRRQRMVEDLLLESLRIMRSEGQLVSFLFPFKYSFYARYGWELAGDRVACKLDINHRPRRVPVEGQVRRWDGRLEILDDIYQEYASGFNSMIARSGSWWHRHTALRRKPRVYVYTGSSGRPEAYIVFEVKDGEFRVFEWVAPTPDSLRALWNFVGDHDSMVRTIHWVGPVNSSIWQMVPNPPEVKRELNTQHMARIVDVPRFFSRYPLPRRAVREPVELEMKIDDPYADWNDGAFRVTVEGSGLSFARLEEISGDLPMVSSSIQALTALALGGRSVSELTHQASLAGSGEGLSLLNRLFAPRVNYIADHF